jgi:hypothetical protein
VTSQDAIWLRCRVSPGMFDHELGVQGEQFDGSAYGLFAPRGAVDHGDQPLTSGQTVPGLVRVDALDRKGDLVLVELPGQTFQNGSLITVTADQLVARPQPQVSPA